MAAGRNRRTIILVVIIIVVLCVGAGLVYLLLGQGIGGGGTGGEQAAAPTITPTPDTVQVIVAARDILRGTRVNATMVTTVPWPRSVALPQGAITVSEFAGLEQVDNRIARVDIFSGQQVLDQMLTPGDQPTGIGATGSDAALLIPPGQVAIAFPLNRMSSVAYALRPGDHVDILMSFRFVDVDEDFQTMLPNNVGFTVFPAGIIAEEGLTIAGREEEGPFGTTLVVVPSETAQRPRQVTQMVIDNVVVLRIGNFPLSDELPIVVTEVPAEEEAPAGEATPTPVPAEGEPTPVPENLPDVITLVMNRQDALVLKYTLEIGADIDFVLRSVQDHEEDFTTESVTLQYILDFYGIGEPPRLPIAHDPRIDLLALLGEPGGTFFGATPTPPPQQ